MAAWNGGNPGIFAAHVIALTIVLVAIQRGVRMPWVEWIPLAAIPFMYAELRWLAGSGAVLAGLNRDMHDGMIQNLDAAFFGVSPAVSLAGRFPVAGVSEVLHLGYLSYYAIIYVPPALAFVTRRPKAFDGMVAALITTFALCFLVFTLFPVAGPRYSWPAPPGVPNGPVRSFSLALLNAGSSRGTAFPSSHVAVAVTQTIAVWRWNARLGAILSVLTALLSVGAVYAGFHYAVDVIAGALLGLVIGLSVSPRASS